MAIDGPASSYSFGSTSAFDTASGFDEQFTGSGAFFKFTSLQLVDDPTISTTDGEIDLALIGVNGITSGGSGATLTFAGLRGLLLATENGSINIGSEISFSGLDNLTFYARGAGSQLTLASSISTLSRLNLYSEGEVNLSGNLSTIDFRSFSGGNFDLSGGSLDAATISVISGANVGIGLKTPFNTIEFLLQAAGNIEVSDSLVVNQVNADQNTGLNISLLAGGSLNIGDDLRLTIAAGDLESGGNIVITSGGDSTIDGAVSLLVDTSNGGHIGNGGNILVSATNLASGSLEAVIDNTSGGVIDSDATIAFNLTGDFATTNAASFVISNQQIGDEPGGGMIGGDASISLNAANVSIGEDSSNSSFDLRIDNSDGHIGGSAAINVVASGDISVQSDASFQVLNDVASSGGTIGSNAEINVSAANFAANTLLASISNRSGVIGQDAIINFGTSGDINTQGDAVFQILNSVQDAGNGSGSNAGTIGGNALLDVSATNISSAGLLRVIIDNHGNGMIGGDATINLNAASVGAGSLEAFLFDYDRGDIGGNALINFVVAGNVSVQGNARFAIDSASDGGAGTIASNATIAASIGSLNAGSLAAYIVNYGSEIGDNATISFGASGDITAGSSAIFEIFNNGLEGTGGIIGSNATINVAGASISTNNFIAAIFNNLGGNIGANAGINVNAENIHAASLFAVIDNRNGGMIGSNAAISFTVSGAVTTDAGNANFSIYGGSESLGGASINVSVGSMNIGGVLAARITAGDGTSFDLQNVLVHANGDIIVGDRITVGGSVTAGGNISAANGIFLNGGSLTAGDLTAGGSIIASGIFADEISAGTDITIAAAEGGFIKASSVTASGMLNLINTSTISYAFAPSDGIIGFTPGRFHPDRWLDRAHGISRFRCSLSMASTQYPTRQMIIRATAATLPSASMPADCRSVRRVILAESMPVAVFLELIPPRAAMVAMSRSMRRATSLSWMEISSPRPALFLWAGRTRSEMADRSASTRRARSRLIPRLKFPPPVRLPARPAAVPKAETFASRAARRDLWVDHVRWRLMWAAVDNSWRSSMRLRRDRVEKSSSVPPVQTATSRCAVEFKPTAASSTFVTLVLAVRSLSMALSAQARTARAAVLAHSMSTAMS